MNFKKCIHNVFECEQKVFTIMFAFFLTGFIFGCFYTSFNSVQAFDNLLSETVISLTLKNVFLIFLVFVFGYTPFGFPLIAFVILSSGICNGIMSYNAVANLNFISVFFVTVLLFVYFSLNIIALFIVSFSSIRLSLIVFNIFRDNKMFSAKTYAKIHLLKFIFFFIFSVIPSVYFSCFASKIISTIY